MSPETGEDLLNERAQQLLKRLVENYIRDGQPVGSRTLSRDVGLTLSAATIRNVMADLETLGFVTSPHTSAGRIPTDKGYRFFVDTLLRYEPLEDAKVAQIQTHLGEHVDNPKALVAAASRMLSSVTRMAGVVTLPRQSHASLSQIEFIPLSDNRVLAVMIVNGREVQNRILQLERRYTADELRRASNYLNQELAGRELSTIRERLVAQLKETRETLNQLMLDAIMLAQQVVDTPVAGKMEYVMAGETNLMDFAELSNVEKLRRLFDAFTQQRDILNLLDHSLKAEGVQIFIGHESGHTILDDCSIVTAPYTLDQEVVGVLGVIGPTRMAYERVIPIVDITAKLLGSALNQRS
ncbi:MAG TPA: heat-inducible transcriptional repressor HrcA [Povalibacter sp.]|uniref:heat-inducible transcriptional repressor HrcA n=1 Tax=Povalibacter sp. TaxID=1962978 RepID=UPI002C0273BE|nr:heat-inducible transcriptional repressor HrcA [Povalibacter sp.]HMN47211.1 heat-inducible transcriptional repressor HrcA [Povalibacter sp.]